MKTIYPRAETWPAPIPLSATKGILISITPFATTTANPFIELICKLESRKARNGIN